MIQKKNMKTMRIVKNSWKKQSKSFLFSNALREREKEIDKERKSRRKKEMRKKEKEKDRAGAWKG
jgi:hypothetical protein